jgi:predicted N-acetyltransferase YhbS
MENQPAVVYASEDPTHQPAIELLHAASFGPGRYARAAFRIREGGPHDTTLSFVTLDGQGKLLASVRQTPVIIGQSAGFVLLGPLAVSPLWKNRGFGRALMGMAVDAAQGAGLRSIILVGDPAYYAPFGFAPVPAGQLQFPGPVDPARVLHADLNDGGLGSISGLVRHANGISGIIPTPAAPG